MGRIATWVTHSPLVARFSFLSSQPLSWLWVSCFCYFPLFLSPPFHQTATPTSFLSAMSLRPSSRTEVRKKGYKIGVDAEEARRRREDNLVEIRKNKREDNLLKKRREGLLNGSFPQPPPLFPSDPSQSPAAVEKKVCICLFLFIPF